MNILTKKTLRKVNRIVSVFVTITTIVWLSGVAMIMPAKAAITDGSLIRATGDYKVYIVNGIYKRWIQSADIFKFYPHLGFSVVQDVSPATRDSYTDSWMVRADGDTKVYEINGDGSKHWLNMTAEEYVLTGHLWAMVAIINTAERDWYSTGAEVHYTGAVTPTPTTTTVPAGNLSVSLSANTPASATIPNKATGVAYTMFNVTAGSASGTITEVVVKRTGAGQASDFANVYLYEGDTRLTNGRSVSSDTNTVTFSNLNLAVSAGATRVLTIKADMKALGGTTGVQNVLGLSKLNGVDVSGVNGNVMNVGAVTISKVTIDQSSSSWNVNVGTTGAEVAKFTIAAGVNDAKLHAITLTNNGTLQNNYITNLKLYSSSVELGSVAAMNGSKMTIVLNSDYVVPKNQTKTFTVTADLIGGRRDDTIIFYADQTSDVNLIDTVYGYGVSFTNAAADDLFLYNTGNQTVTMAGGKITLALNGPAAGTIGKNTTNQTLLKFNMTSEPNVTVKSLKLNLQAKLGTNTADANWALVKNVKIVDTDSGTTLVGPLSDMSAGTSNGGTTGAAGTLKYYKVFTDTFDIAAGVTKHLAVQADIDSTFVVGDSDSLTADIDLSGTNYIYDNTAGQYVVAANVVPTTLTGNKQTVAAASLTVAKGNAVNRTVVKGGSVDGLNVVLTAGTADSLTVNKIIARVYADNDAPTANVYTFNNSGYGDTSANTAVSTVSLYEGSTLVKGPVNLSLVGTVANTSDTTGYYKAEFTSLNYAVAAGAQKNLTLKVNTSTSTSAVTYVAVDVLRDATDIEVQDSKGNLLTNTGILTANTSLNLATTPSPVLTVSLGGTLAAAVDGTTPLADVVVSGTSNVEFAKYKFTATDDAFVITGLSIDNASADYDDDIVKITLVYPTDAAGTTATKDAYLSAGNVTLASGQLNMYVPKDKTAVLTIKGDLNTVANGADSGDLPKFTLTTSGANLTNSFIAVGEASGTTKYGATDTIALANTNVNAMTVRKTKVVGKVASDSPSGTHSASAQDLIAAFQFDATAEPNSSQNTVLSEVTVQITGSLINGTTTTVPVTFYTSASSFDAGHALNSSPISIAGVLDGTSTATAIAFDVHNEFSSTMKAYAVIDTTNAAAFTDAASTDSKLVMRITTYNWNDGSVAAITPVTGIPVIANTLSY